MNRLRRHLLRVGLTGSALAAAFAAGLLAPRRVLAGEWPKAAFDATDVDTAMSGVGIVGPATTEDILIKAPEIAENGAQVPIEVRSNIPDTRIIYVFVDKNPEPMAGSFEFMSGAEPFISTRVKMAETSNLRIVAQAGGKYFMAMREIKVTIGGCGDA
jgi:sulfur-oxidizing protein SoxY